MLFSYFPGISLGPVQKPQVSKTMLPFLTELLDYSALVAAEGKGMVQNAWKVTTHKQRGAQCQALLICLALTNSTLNQSTLESFSLSLNNSWLFNFGLYQKIYNA